MNRTIQFCVPTDVLVEFAEELVSRNLQATIAGANEEGEILLDLSYDKEDTSEVDKMESFLENLKEEAGLDNE